MIMKPAHLPLSEEGWVAIEKETVDALVVRRRIRGKSAIRKMRRKVRMKFKGKKKRKSECIFFE